MAGLSAVRWAAEERDDLVPIIFRSLAAAMDHPGRAVRLGMFAEAPPPVNAASAAVALALTRRETPVWTDIAPRTQAPRWLCAETGASLVTEPGMASLALITIPARMPRLQRFRLGDEQRPESAALLVIQVRELSRSGARTLLGADGQRVGISPGGLPETFWADWSALHPFHPLGVDVLFTCGDELVALPRELRVAGRRRSTRVQAAQHA
jgi:alpha-D-ribose 1-methylphosphonate 5-triphosphate synthase subunit PhnH